MGIHGGDHIPAPKPTAPPVTMATLPANLPSGDVVTGVVSDVVGAWDAIVYISGGSLDLKNNI